MSRKFNIHIRPRRIRRTPGIRRLFSETSVSPSHLVAPLFVKDPWSLSSSYFFPPASCLPVGQPRRRRDRHLPLHRTFPPHEGRSGRAQPQGPHPPHPTGSAKRTAGSACLRRCRPRSLHLPWSRRCPR
ncbi:hypothetical protein EBZ02_09785 [bacterium]|nr:hypothetical protein [bacterium]